MPFGLFGPKHYPPRGFPIYDLPAEYLAWFALKGFPEGRLGELLRIVYQTKADGCDGVFDVIRHKADGRFKLRKPPKREWKFEWRKMGGSRCVLMTPLKKKATPQERGRLFADLK